MNEDETLIELDEIINSSHTVQHTFDPWQPSFITNENHTTYNGFIGKNEEENINNIKEIKTIEQINRDIASIKKALKDILCIDIDNYGDNND